MKRSFYAVACVVFSWLLAVNSGAILFAQGYSAQEEFWMLLTKQERYLHFSKTHDGGISARNETVGLVSPLEFFVDSAVVEDLGLTQKVVEEIESHFEQALSEQKETREQFSKEQKEKTAERSTKADSLKALQLKTRETWLRFFGKANAELNGRQRRRLEEIQFQFLVFRGGYSQLLREPAIQKKLQMSGKDDALSGSLIEKLVEAQEGVARELLVTEKTLVSEALDIWLESLSAKQRKVFNRDWGEVLKISGGVGLLVESLDSTFAIDFDEVGSSELQLIWAAPGFEHAADGNINVNVPSSQSGKGKSDRGDQSVAEASKKPTPSSLKQLYALQHLFRSGFVGDLITLLPDQIVEVVEINEEFEKLKSIAVMGIAGEFDVEVKNVIQVKSKSGTLGDQPIYDWPEDMTLIEAETDKRMEASAQKTFDKLLDVLLPHQLKELKLAVARLQVRSHGPLSDIRYGVLREELGLSNSDVESLNQAAVEARKSLCEKSLAARYQAIEKINDVLPDDLRRNVKAKLGKPLSCDYCDLRNFALALLTVPEDSSTEQ